MSYIVYDTKSTRRLAEKRYGKEFYATEGAAKAAKTRMSKKAQFAEYDLAVAESDFYAKNIEKMVKRVNLISGKEYWESINTPSYCSPSSEAYWSM
jgi:hypothetical protein